MWFNIAIWLLAGFSLTWSWIKDREKTRRALMKGWRAFESILPDFAGVLILISLTLTMLPPRTITTLIGSQTSFWGMLLTSAIGAITLIPGFIAFPLARSLLEMGAGIKQIAVFVSTLMMVGIVTAPMETKYFGKKSTILRNLLAYAFSFVTAFIVGMVAER
ncbi:MAG TPA: permease [Clostridia bacterium]|nr:permease [Clostridia bacterium]